MLEGLVIQSHKGPYAVAFNRDVLEDCKQLLDGQAHCIVDSNIKRLYGDRLGAVCEHPNTIFVDATEEAKSIDRIIPVIQRLVDDGVRRDHVLVAIGGGVIQDITCFIASTLLRGVPWRFVPTTLLAQADSCIGSKSSINLGTVKNILGTFNPPREIIVCTAFLDTLDQRDMRSGFGELLKVHAIEGRQSFDRLAADYDKLLDDRALLLHYVRNALVIKQRFIERDEFDQNVRNIFNYGHSFGHAIESATAFGVPHGVAVSMGMAMANHIASLRGLLPEGHRERMEPALRKNNAAYRDINIETDALVGALTKDKKNTARKLVLIFPVGTEADVQRTEVPLDNDFIQQCSIALQDLRK